MKENYLHQLTLISLRTGHDILSTLPQFDCTLSLDNFLHTVSIELTKLIKTNLSRIALHMTTLPKF